MNCEKCLNLVGNRCKLNKHDIYEPIFSDDGRIIKLNYDCIFKNTQHQDLDFYTSHMLAMCNIAISSYFILTRDNLGKMMDLMKVEEKYAKESPIGQFNVLTKENFSVEEVTALSTVISHYSQKLNNRLWKMSFIKDESLEFDADTNYPRYIIDNCQLPYSMVLENEEDFALAQNFKYRCFSSPVPIAYYKIYSIKHLRLLIESREKNAEIQT